MPIERLTAEELVTLLEAAAKGKLHFNVEKNGEAFVLPPEWMQFINVDFVYRRHEKVDVETTLGTGADVTITVPTGEIWRIFIVELEVNCDATVATRSAVARGNSTGVILAPITGNWVSTAVSLTASQKGKATFTGNAEWDNDNGTLTRVATGPVPWTALAGSTIVSAVSSIQAGDTVGLRVIFHREKA